MVQRAVAPLIRLLITRGHFVQVETSGVAWRDVPDSCWITFSPKMQIGARCAGQFWRRADEVKIIISNATDAGLYDPDLRSFSGRIYFQPEYSRMQETVPDCVRACLKYGGKISTQIHKTLQLP
jgi:organic radical activating enzyme